MNEIRTNNYSYPINCRNGSSHKAQTVKLLEYGKFINLKDSEYVAIPQNSILTLGGKYKMDLGSKKILSDLSRLKKGEALVIGRNDFNPDDLTISRKQFKLFMHNGNLYIANMSQYGTLFMIDRKPVNPSSMPQYHQVHRQESPIENYNPQYLKDTYGKKNVDFKQIFREKYNKLRLAEYSMESTFRNCSPDSVQKTSFEDPAKGRSHFENGWVYRFFGNSYRSETSSDRISLNVQADSRLLKELDNLIITGQYKDAQGKIRTISEDSRNNVIYKVPQEPQKWTKRHDPITMYFSGPIHESFLNAVSDISKRYARQSQNGVPLVGALPGKPWIGVEKEPNEDDCLKLAQKVEKINPSFAREIKSYCYEKWNHMDGFYNFACSAGQFEAVKSTVREYFAYRNMIQK